MTNVPGRAVAVSTASLVLGPPVALGLSELAGALGADFDIAQRLLLVSMVVLVWSGQVLALWWSWKVRGPNWYLDRPLMAFATLVAAGPVVLAAMLAHWWL